MNIIDPNHPYSDDDDRNPVSDSPDDRAPWSTALTASSESVLAEIGLLAPLMPRFWSAMSLASPGPDGDEGNLAIARVVCGADWPTVQRLFVLHVALIEGLHDWGLLGLDVEAAVRIRVLLQYADEQAFSPKLGWPPELNGIAHTPHDLVELGEILAERLSTVPEEKSQIFLWSTPAWVDALPGLLGHPEYFSLDPQFTDAFMVDAQARAERVGRLDELVGAWATSGPHGDLDNGELWAQLGDDGLTEFLATDGADVLDEGPLEAQLRQAVLQAHGIASGDLSDRVQWLAALRLALRGEIGLTAASSLTDLRPWAHERMLRFGREVLSPSIP
jgi:hypothetical protein